MHVTSAYRSRVAFRTYAIFIAMFVAVITSLFPSYAYAEEASGALSSAYGSNALIAATSDLGTQESGHDAVLSAQSSYTPTSVSNAWKHDYYYYWAVPATSYLHVNSNTLERVQFTGDELVVETIASDLKTVTSQTTIPSSTYQPSNLSSESAFVWGGFFSGESDNYVVTGQTNMNEDNDLVVFRITKYTKDWEYVAAAEIEGANTTTPFDAGSCDMAELNGSLYIRTCHEMYRSNDGIIHQANVQLVIDESDMAVTMQLTDVMSYSMGYVSHSFNQYLTVLSGAVYGLDHGDAYPRAITIKNLDYYGDEVAIMGFPGDIGENKTGATVGGFEASASTGNVLIVGSRNSDDSIDSGKPCNVWIATAPSDLSTSTARKLTSYSSDSEEWADNPFLVKVSDDRFLALWGIKNYEGHTGMIAYQFVDGNGNTLSSTKTVEGMLSDCEPVVYDGRIVWYEGGGGEPGYYAIDASTGEYSKYESLGSATMTVEGTEVMWYDSKTDEYVKALPFQYARTCPETTLTFGASTLVEGEDYEIDYQIDHDKAQGTVTVIGKGRFAGQSRSQTFDIMVVDMNDCYIAGVDDMTYTGKPVVQDEVEVWYRYSSEGLIEGVDYTIAYTDNVEAGTASYVVTGSGLLCGTIEGTFEIEQAQISKIELSSSSYAYDGKRKSPTVTVRDANGVKLRENIDYTVSVPAGRIDPGTYTYKATGKGNYTGTVSTNLKISGSKPAPVSTPDAEPELESTQDGKNVARSHRLAGDTALDTMAAIVDEGDFEQGEAVVLATADGYWDALTAAGIAGLADAPVLMTDGTMLSQQTARQLFKLAPQTVIICGGTAAVSVQVELQAVSVSGAYNVIRCAGSTATGTACEIFKEGQRSGNWSDTAFVCTNNGYWDALAAAPVSYAKHMPIFLTEGSSDISNETVSAMKRGGIKRVYIVGGRYAITQAVLDKLGRNGIKVVDRLWGDDAIETSEKVAQFGVDKMGMTADKMGVATTGGYWDALAGAAICGEKGSVLVLADGPYADSITTFMKKHADEITTFYIFGGTAAVSSATEKAALAAAK